MSPPSGCAGMKPEGLGHFGGLGLELARQAPGLLRLRSPLREVRTNSIPFGAAPLEILGTAGSDSHIVRLPSGSDNREDSALTSEAYSDFAIMENDWRLWKSCLTSPDATENTQKAVSPTDYDSGNHE
ncbi:hypothetical protein TREES_T100004231 [Tupaia chinensis]|uniref:Uncharacterized protein n=1 Tax=Tupaia chinensis TaxID=246437 RepID=L9KHJ8_TUPCH|nr:hypothetical protein TREES_T100004231 [Tupaia chinensis]